MAVVVVHPLEVVDVGHQQQRRFTAARHAVDFARQAQLEGAAVGQPRQGVAAGQVHQPVQQGLQPGRAAGLARGQRVAALLQQLQGRVHVQAGQRISLGSGGGRGLWQGRGGTLLANKATQQTAAGVGCGAV